MISFVYIDRDILFVVKLLKDVYVSLLNSVGVLWQDLDIMAFIIIVIYFGRVVLIVIAGIYGTILFTTIIKIFRILLYFDLILIE